jgi:hypothetical protein
MVLNTHAPSNTCKFSFNTIIKTHIPHVEVVDLKSSVASSDEERLAAGISMIGLQTNKLSGAQRKRLIRERKMREGTWMEKKTSKKNSFISG